MNNIKQPSVAGTFYSSNKNELLKQIEYFKQVSANDYEYKSRAVIVPHAGLIYSGRLAYDGLKSLKGDLKTLIIFAPSHHARFDNLVLSSYKMWETTLGTIELDTDIVEKLNKDFNLQFNDEAFKNEHSAEIELPLIQALFEDIKIVPILVGNADYNNITDIIDYFWNDEKIGFVISSDLSHFYKNEDAIRLDSFTAQLIETNNYKQFKQGQACGILGILGLLKFAENKNYSLIRVSMANSSAVNNDTSSVVGYGSWFLYDDSKNVFLKKFYSEKIIQICKEAVISSLEHRELRINDLAQVFYENGACFVTLTKFENLRGCIGSITAYEPLAEDLIHNAISAAFNDSRFNPVEKDEFEHLDFAISLLSHPQEMTFKDEEDLLSQIVPYKDGIIIEDKGHRAVYLPSVWEQLPDKVSFLNSLKVKAGLPYNHFSETFKAYRYYTEYIK